MPPPITPFGVFHTVVSILPIPLGLYAFYHDGRIDPGNRLGQSYLATMFVGSVTGLMIFHHGGFGPGHVLSILTIVLLLLGMFAKKLNLLGRGAPYVETISLSLTYFLLMFFATTETLTRLPVEHPFAPSQEAPELIPIRLLLLLLLLAGVGYQVYKIRKSRPAEAR